MTRHAAYAVTSTGRRRRTPFASFPHADAARAWVSAHPDEPVAFVPPLPLVHDTYFTRCGAVSGEHTDDRTAVTCPKCIESRAETEAKIKESVHNAPRLGPEAVARLRAIIHGRVRPPAPRREDGDR